MKYLMKSKFFVENKKYIKTYEEHEEHNYPENIRKDIIYLADAQGTGNVGYIIDVIDYYNLTEEQIHNLRLSVDYSYINYQDYRYIVNHIINFNDVGDSIAEGKFKLSYEKNFKTKVINLTEPYMIVHTNENSRKFDLYKCETLNSHDLSEIIGEIPKEYPFGKKYLLGLGRYRGKFNNNKALWEIYKDTERESQFIEVYDEENIHILTDDEIEIINMKENIKKYNL